MKKGIRKTLSMIIALTIIFQMLIPIIPELNIEVFAADETSKETEEISRNYEVKEEETWDISANRDGSVIAKWTLKDRTLRISGTGEMRDWEFNSKEDWHNTQYTNVIENIMIENGITSIGSYAFYGCSSLESINIPEGVTSIGDNAFYRCSSLESIDIPSSVTSIESYAFYECSSLESIDIPSSVTSIESYAFYRCSSLESIDIPNSVTRIGQSAFSGCSSLESIEIPESATSIGSYAFEGCSSLESINVDINNKKYVSEDGILFNKDETKMVTYPAGKNDIREYIIPSTVTSVESNAFDRCSSLESITIPEGVTSIGWGAFSECSSLESINIPEGVTYIGYDAFRKCSSLKSINIPSSVTSIGWYAFYRCSSLESINIPESVASIGDSAFEGCSSLESITISEGVTSIESRSFYECSSLKDINIPSSVTSIGSYAFSGCSSLESINIPESVTSIGSNAIDKTTIIYTKLNSEGHRYAEESGQGYILEGEETENTEEISRNHEIKEEETWDVSANGDGTVIAKWTLKDRTLRMSGTGEMKDWKNYSREDWHKTQYMNIIENVMIENGITSIGSYAFSGCSSLESINIPEGVTSIENGAFEGCNSLKSIDIPSSVTSIGSYAFSECSSLKDISILNSVTRIGSYAFSGCSSLESIDIPSSVTSIGSYAFEGCSSLGSINIPEGVTSIEDRAFLGCSSLESINVDINNKKYVSEDGILFNKEKTEIIKYPEGKNDKREYIIPSTVISIGSYAFSGCSSLESINIPEGVTSIEYSVFSGCSSLESIDIPSSVTSIGSYAFYGCSSLESINIPEGVTSIRFSTFEGCSSLESINIPESVTSIGDFAFEGCSSLESITIPSSVTSIGDRAFYECSSLESIIIPNGVTSIGDEAFSGCNKLIIYTNSNSEDHRYAEENKQSYVIDDEGPTATFTPNGNHNPQKGHTIKVNVEDDHKSVGVEKGSLKYLWTQSEEVPIKESFTQGFENGQTITKNIGDGIWYLWVYAKDNLDNETIKRSESFNFDNTAPSVNVQYSTKDSTNKNIEVKLTSNEEIQELEGWTLSNDKKTLEKQYSVNTKETVIVKDIAGNEIKANIEINNIDKVAPKVEVEYSTKELTRENVKVTISSNEQIQNVEGWALSSDKKILTKEYKENIQETIVVKDLAGNETEVNININNIDKVAPNVKVEYSTEELTRENVVVRITSNEEIQEIEGWEISEDKKVLTREYSENIEETVIVKDIAGNEKEVEIEISNIDKNGLIEKIEYSTKNPTKENVKVTIVTNEEIEETEGWELSENKKELTKEYSENQKETIVIKDLKGNKLKINIRVENIDREEPKVQVEYSTKEITRDNVVVKIKANEELQEIEGWTLSEDKKELTKEYNGNTSETITIRDLAGNETEATIEITNIDKVAPVLNITYSTKNPTKENVKVTITSNEQIQSIEGWTLSSDKKTLTKEYSANVKETVIVKDLAGNETEATIEITNIDKVAPVLNVTYSTKNPTKENVKVTITSNEEIQSIEGWTLSSDKKTLTKEYSANTRETIVINDLVGNEAEATIEITNIDKVAPVLNVTYSTKNPTKENVKVTITSNEPIQSVTGWTLSSDKKTLTKEYSANTKETIIVKDLAGNETGATIEITNIDKVAPVLNVTYSTKNPIKENVKVTITSNEPIQSVTGWTLSSDKKTLTKEYSANTKETIVVKDLAGNETRVTIEIDNIEGKPEITIGDINEDRKIDITDFLMLKRHLIAGNKKDWILTGNRLLAADMNENGKVDISDVLILKRNIINNL